MIGKKDLIFENRHNIFVPKIKSNKLGDFLPGASFEALDIMGKMLSLNPYYRPTIDEILEHQFFKEEESQNSIFWKYLDNLSHTKEKPKPKKDLKKKGYNKSMENLKLEEIKEKLEKLSIEQTSLKYIQPEGKDNSNLSRRLSIDNDSIKIENLDSAKSKYSILKNEESNSTLQDQKLHNNQVSNDINNINKQKQYWKLAPLQNSNESKRNMFSLNKFKSDFDKNSKYQNLYYSFFQFNYSLTFIHESKE